MMSRGRFYNPQFDLFLPTIVDLRFRDQKDTMERPFFSLSKSKRMKPIEYLNENDGIFVTVQPHQDYGMATIWDADILIWAASVLCDMKNRGVNDIPRVLTFQPYDLLKAIGRSTGGSDYGQLRDALERLKTTVITTNIRLKKRGQKNTMFSWIDQWDDLIDAQTRESRGLTLTVSDWFYRGVTEDGGLLSIDAAYFAITGGRERWLYRVARKHAGGNGADGFAISMPTLFEKSGAEGTYRRFKFEILRIVTRNDLPGFALSILTGSDGEPLVHMLKREHAGQGEPQAWRPAPKQAPRQRPAAQDDVARAQPLPLLNPIIRTLSERTIVQVRRDFPDWDIYALQAEFNEWLDGDPAREPKDYEAAFYGFVKQHHQRNRAFVG